MWANGDNAHPYPAVPPQGLEQFGHPTGRPGGADLLAGARPPRKGRNEMAANALKTNDLAKCLISRPNDFKDLRQASRAGSAWPGGGRWRGEASSCERASRTRRSRARSGAIAIAAAYPWIAAPTGPPTPSPACRKTRKKLRKRAAKALKSLARVTLCALLTGSPCRPRSACSRSYRSGSAARPAQTACRPACGPREWRRA